MSHPEQLYTVDKKLILVSDTVGVLKYIKEINMSIEKLFW